MDEPRSSKEPAQAPIIAPGHTFGSVTDKIASIVLTKSAPIPWYVAAFIGFLCTMMLFYAITYLLLKGVGIWGVNIPIGWGFAIINFVWWIGIGHAGTLISAILLLLNQKWRTSINRFAEAMTIFAVMCAGLFPLIHTGPPLAGVVLADPLPEHDGGLAAVPQPAHLGRLRDLDLRHRVAALLVRRARSPTWRRCATRRCTRCSRRCTASRRSAGAAPRGTGRATRRPTCCWPASRRRSSSRCTRSSASTSRSASSRAGTPRSSRPTSWRARSTPASPWC